MNNYKKGFNEKSKPSSWKTKHT